MSTHEFVRGIGHVPTCAPKTSTEAQRARWKAELLKGRFTLENAHMWPPAERTFLLRQHGYDERQPRLDDPYALGSFGEHARRVPGGYACGSCPMVCASRTDLDAHFVLHLGLKPYACRFCDVCFAHKRNRSKHERSMLPGHLNIKSSRCGVCGKTFQHGHSLVSHMLTHTKDPKPESCRCGVCDKVYANAQNCNRHKRTKHSGYYAKTKKKRKRIATITRAPSVQASKHAKRISETLTSGVVMLSPVPDSDDEEDLMEAIKRASSCGERPVAQV